jgi:hypothetical protein
MITHGTPPVAHGGWSEFIKDFGIGLPRFGRVCVEMCVDSYEIENFYYNQWVIVMFGGRGGIRTHGTLAGTPVFKTGALNHSATLPNQ